MAAYVGQIQSGVSSFVSSTLTSGGNFLTKFQKESLKDVETLAKAAQRGLVFFGSLGHVCLESGRGAALLAASKGTSSLAALINAPATAFTVFRTGKAVSGVDLNLLAIHTLQFFKAAADFKILDSARFTAVAERIPFVGSKVAGLSFNKIFQPLVAAICAQKLYVKVGAVKAGSLKERVSFAADSAKLGAAALHIAKDFANLTRFSSFIPGLEFAGAALSFVNVYNEKSA